MQNNELKDRILRMLEEDREFRFAIMGLIGLEGIKESIDLLREILYMVKDRLDKLEDRHARLIDAQARTDERVGKLEDAVARLVDAQTRLEQRVGKLEDAVARLIDAQARTDERVGKLEDAVARLVDAQARTELAISNLRKEVGRLSDTIGFGLEDIARVVVPGYLYRHEKIVLDKLERRFMLVDGEEVEINLYGEGMKEGKKVIVVGESKARIYSKEVREFDDTINKVGFKDALKFMFGYLIHPSAEEEARKKGILLIASYMR